MTETPPLAVRCSFYRRLKATDQPTYRYDHITVDGYDPGPLHTGLAPAVGDFIYLNHWHDPDEEDLTGGYVVIARSWTIVEYGSAAWRRGEQYPDEGPGLDIIVEPAVGPFVNQEASRDELIIRRAEKAIENARRAVKEATDD